MYGARARETPEDITEREIRREIRAVLPDIFSGFILLFLELYMPLKYEYVSPGDVASAASSSTALLESCSKLVSASRFEQVRTFRQWLLPILQKHIAE